MTGKRGSQAIRPAKNHEWTLRCASREVAEGWENLCKQQPGVIATLYDQLTEEWRPSLVRHQRQDTRGVDHQGICQSSERNQVVQRVAGLKNPEIKRSTRGA